MGSETSQLAAGLAQAEAHAHRVAQAASLLRQAPAGQLALAKATSNLFRDRRRDARQRLDLGQLRQVLACDEAANWVDVEGMCTYEELVAWCLPRGSMPAVVPQLKTITVGGAAAGVGVEATSFRHGLVHHTVQELEVLLPGGEVVLCTAGNAHRDLFFGFPNSYGSLGYALRLRLCTQRVRPFVQARYQRFDDPEAFFAALARACGGDADFVDGVVFGPRELVLCTGRFVRQAPWRSDYGYQRIFWRSLRERNEDYLATLDWLWRWDTDWFWCSSHFGAQHPLVRRLLGRSRLNSHTWQRWMRLNARLQLTQRVARWRGLWRESVIQDVDLPLDRAPQFLEFFQREVGILPIWICPLHGDPPGTRFPFYALRSAPLYVNFGFWDVLQGPEPHPPGHFNRLIEAEVMRLGGIKSLYSESYFSRDEFAQAYGMDEYQRLKDKYDPGHRAPDLYDKCVRCA